MSWPRPLRRASSGQPVAMAGLKGSGLSGRIGAKGVSDARPGSSITLAVAVPGHQVKSVRWKAAGTRLSVLKNVKKNGTLLTFTIPRTFTERGLLLSATATIEDGRTVQVDQIVRVGRSITAPKAQRQPRTRSIEEPTAGPRRCSGLRMSLLVGSDDTLDFLDEAIDLPVCEEGDAECDDPDDETADPRPT